MPGTGPPTNITKTIIGHRIAGRINHNVSHHCDSQLPLQPLRRSDWRPAYPKDVLGGKTYFFFNYEGFNFPDSETIARNLPSAALRLGLLTDDMTGTLYNLNPTAVTYNGITYPGTHQRPAWNWDQSSRPDDMEQVRASLEWR